MPRTVAPNVITLAGFICLLQSAYITYYKYDYYPTLVTFLNILLFFAYQTLDALDGKHARKIKNSSPVGELFDHTCDNIGVIFLTFTLCWTFHLRDPSTMWYIVNSVKLIFLYFHMCALKNKTITFNRYTGPGEFECIAMFLLFLHTLGLNIYLPQFTKYIFASIYVGLSAFVAKTSLNLEYSDRNGILLCTSYKLVTLALYFEEMTYIDVICDGLFWCIMTSEMILSKMALTRQMAPIIVTYAMLSVISNWITIFFSAFYYVTVFGSLCKYMNISMFTVNQNVYVNGVFDLCHLGHKRLFENALKFGNRLIVGVCADHDVKKYKRNPIMTVNERVEAVKACKFVSEVIPNAPWQDISEEFINKNNIHVVAHSQEYDNPLDTYYETPRKLSITKVLPRTEGMSTSELIRRINEYSVSDNL